MVDWACYVGCGDFAADDPSRGCVDPTLAKIARRLSTSIHLPGGVPEPDYFPLMAATARTNGLIPTRRVGLHYLHDGIERYAHDDSMSREGALAWVRAHLADEPPPAKPEWSRSMVMSTEAAQQVSRAVRTIGGYWTADDHRSGGLLNDAAAAEQLIYVHEAHESTDLSWNAHPLLMAYRRLIAAIDSESGRSEHAAIPRRLLDDEGALVLWQISEGRRRQVGHDA